MLAKLSHILSCVSSDEFYQVISSEKRAHTGSVLSVLPLVNFVCL